MPWIREDRFLQPAAGSDCRRQRARPLFRSLCCPLPKSTFFPHGCTDLSIRQLGRRIQAMSDRQAQVRADGVYSGLGLPSAVKHGRRRTRMWLLSLASCATRRIQLSASILRHSPRHVLNFAAERVMDWQEAEDSARHYAHGAHHSARGLRNRRPIGGPFGDRRSARRAWTWDRDSREADSESWVGREMKACQLLPATLHPASCPRLRCPCQTIERIARPKSPLPREGDRPHPDGPIANPVPCRPICHAGWAVMILACTHSLVVGKKKALVFVFGRYALPEHPLAYLVAGRPW